MIFLIADEMRNTESAIISSYPTSASGINVFIKYQIFRKISRARNFGHFVGNFSLIILSVSIFGSQTTGYTSRLYTASREPIRLPEISISSVINILNIHYCT